MDWTNMLSPIIQTVAVAFIGWALKKYLGIEMDKNQRAQAEGVVAGVDEKARALFKRTGGKEKMTSEAKHQTAIADLKVLNPGESDAKITVLTDSAVGVVKTVGATAIPCDPPIVVGSP